MKILNRFFAACILLGLVCFVESVSAQPEGRIIIESFSPQEIHDQVQPYADEVASSLANVGIGMKVYLRAKPLPTHAITGATFSLKEKPEGSAAILETTTDALVVTLRPDSAGQYQIGLVVSNDEGSSGEITLWINAATFVGVGTIVNDDLSVGGFKGQCAICHADKEATWKETRHGTVLERKLNLDTRQGAVSTFFSAGCVECHSTGWYAGDNGGMDDRINAELSEGETFTLPTLGDGAWDQFIADFPDAAKMANVQCESCHGPGSGHLGRHDKNQIDFGLQYGVCAQCHEEEPYHTIPTQWKTTKHAVSFENPSAPGREYMNRKGCEKCHTGTGFIEVTEQGKASTAPYTIPAPVSCQICHDPHSVENEHQLRLLGSVTLGNGDIVTGGGNGQLCMNCHISRRNGPEYAQEYHSRFGPHGSNQTDMNFGANAIEYGQEVGGSGHVGIMENLCTDCHMAEPPSAKKNAVGEHTWRMVGEDESTGAEVEHVEVCQQCHGAGILSFDDIKAKEDYDEDGSIEGVKSEIAGLMDKLGHILPPLGEPDVTVTRDYTVTELGAAYNFFFVEEDGSYGLHNAPYAINILKLAIKAVTTGDIGTTDLAITDVPNDQGRQARVMWDRFPGDGTSTDPLQEYGVWRRVDNLGKTAIPVATLQALHKVAAEGDIGAVYETPEGAWEYVARVPAAGLARYGAIVPTLGDSTDAGIIYSVYHVSGHYQSGNVVHSEVDSGFSVDNIAPLPPTLMGANVSAGKITLMWDLDIEDPQNVDFAYFTVYRSVNDNFVPGAASRLTTTIEKSYEDNVDAGQLYYYIITAADANGNESEYSVQIDSRGDIITSIKEVAGIPTTYSLFQNYPNPFNPTTNIKFALPIVGHVRLTIYDMRGVEVRTLVDATMPAGYATMQWDGRDNAGRTVASGIYIYRVLSRNYAASKKMVLLK